MDVLSRRPSSALNPDALPFVPLAYRTVEDFSDQWWELVKTTSWFRDYWLRECFVEEAVASRGGSDLFGDEVEAFLPEIGDIFDGYQKTEEENGKEKGNLDVIAWGAQKWRGLRGGGESPKFAEKAPRIVKMRPTPRTIQQPR
ncbi:hypothetical protein Taro_040605 [Colocasia esculenta]|uniref:Early response to dehydration 15-like protein n=1 Tax=Colocasia esculenta TaxID=4460 RepID=A0A843WQW8_COLES|nr:hypothetical protein [Colocasia esculenta]